MNDAHGYIMCVLSALAIGELDVLDFSHFGSKRSSIFQKFCTITGILIEAYLTEKQVSGR